MRSAAAIPKSQPFSGNTIYGPKCDSWADTVKPDVFPHTSYRAAGGTRAVRLAVSHRASANCEALGESASCPRIAPAFLARRGILEAVRQSLKYPFGGLRTTGSSTVPASNRRKQTGEVHGGTNRSRESDGTQVVVVLHTLPSLDDPLRKSSALRAC
jgi:hypothetical protein